MEPICFVLVLQKISLHLQVVSLCQSYQMGCQFSILTSAPNNMRQYVCYRFLSNLYCAVCVILYLQYLIHFITFTIPKGLVFPKRQVVPEIYC